MCEFYIIKMDDKNKNIENKVPVTDKPAEKVERAFKHIVRVANVDVPGNKPIRIAMKKIKGIGTNLADSLCLVAGVNKQTKAGELSELEIKKLNDSIKNITTTTIPKWMLNRQKDYESGENRHIITGDLAFVKDNDIKRLKKIKSNRGIRHGKGLPVRGQRTRSNFRKSKGKVVGVKKKSSAKSGK